MDNIVKSTSNLFLYQNLIIFEGYSSDDEESLVIADIKDYVEIYGRLIYQQPAYANILNSKVSLQLDEKVVEGRLKQQLLVP